MTDQESNPGPVDPDLTLEVVRHGITIGSLRSVVPEDAHLLSDWRDANRRWFLSEFAPNVAGTEAWIRSIRETSDRLLFVVGTGADLRLYLSRTTRKS